MHSILKKCKNCEDLSLLLSKIECTIIFMLKKKHSIQVYNLEDNFDEDRLKSLFRYKRVLNKRIYDCSYPSKNIKTSDLIQQASLLAFRGEDCSECQTCN